MTARTTMTAEELLQLPDNGSRHELVDGELRELPLAGGEHGFVAGRALYRLTNFIEQTRPGGAVFAAETGFRLRRNPDTVRAPDAAFVVASRLTQARVAGYPDLAPDLVVEVVSPGDLVSEVLAKVAEWLRAGSQIVWVLYPPRRSATVYRQSGEVQVLLEDELLMAEPVLPGFSCRVGDLF